MVYVTKASLGRLDEIRQPANFVKITPENSKAEGKRSRN